ncbi:MAG: CCA tRNA nucleotidyltransferase [Phycisphaerae bacterium]
MSASANKATSLWVLRRLRAAGHKALFAGGCVRDMLLGRAPGDYDIATDATPDQVRRLFPHVLLVGAKFGVAMVIHNRRRVEVTTFRSDLSYSDGRRPEGVVFSSPREDALRRDFTINGMFFDPIAGEVIDYVGGREDLARRVIRTIGSAHDRLGEDYLRMVRAVRFAVRLGFALDADTAGAIRELAPKITSISGERIFDELSKMLSIASAGAALAMLDELGLARAILPELFEKKELWPAAVARVRHVAEEADLTLVLAALLCELPPKVIRGIIRRWGASNELLEALCWMAKHLDGWRTAADAPPHEFKPIAAGRHFDRLRRLWRAREEAVSGGQAQSRRIARRLGAIPPGQLAPPPLVTGSDLARMGLPEGPRVGRVLKELYNAQLDDEKMTRRDALAMAHRLVDKSESRSTKSETGFQ